MTARAVPLGLGAAAIVYFLRTVDFPIDWIDEGHLVYMGWRVSEGALPYRDFHHIYGPSTFFVNGLLFRLFGPHLLVTRISVAVLKGVMAGLVYALARRVADWCCALAVYVVFVAVWGSGLWFFNAPYASHYQTTLGLAGLLILLASSDSVVARVVSGLCFGLAATCKQTGGLLAFLALLLFVVLQTRTASASTARGVRPRTAGGAERAIRLGVALGTAGPCIAYAVATGEPRGAFFLVTPILAAAAFVGFLEAREGGSLPEPGTARALGWPVVGFLVPVLGEAALYASKGSARAALYDALLLPRKLIWFIPVQRPGWREALLAVGLVTGLASVRILRARRSREGRGWPGRATPIFAAFVASAVLLVGGAGAGGISGYVRALGWQGDAWRILYWMPIGAVWGTMIALLFGVAPDRYASLASLTFVAAAALLQLQPAADFPHALMGLPLALPLVAYHLSASHEAAPERRARGRSLSVAVIVLLVAGLISPFVRLRPAPFRWCDGRVSPAEGRATGIRSFDCKLFEVQRMVEVLDRTASRDTELLVIPDEQMIYFLAGRRSAMEQEEFTLYLIRMGLVSDANARAMVDQDRVIERLTRTQPLVVRSDDDAATMPFTRALPALDAYLDRTYQIIGTAGRFRILESRAGKRGA